jgi:hypothetical protein
MTANLFSIPIFFIAFRECLEASLIIAILLGLVEQIVLHQSSASATTSATITVSNVEDDKYSATGIAQSYLTRQREHEEEEPIDNRLLIRKLRIQVCSSFLFYFPSNAPKDIPWRVHRTLHSSQKHPISGQNQKSYGKGYSPLLREFRSSSVRMCD